MKCQTCTRFGTLPLLPKAVVDDRSPCSHVPTVWIASEDFTRRRLHTGCWRDPNRGAAEADAPWEVSDPRSCGPENSESRGLARQLLTKRCSDTEWSSVACWVWCDCHIQTKRNPGCNAKRCPCARILPGEYPSGCDESVWCGLFPLRRIGKGYHSRFSDRDREQCLWRLPLFGKCHHSWFGD